MKWMRCSPQRASHHRSLRLAASWNGAVEATLADATLRRPPAVRYPWHGKRGQHTEHLGRLLAEMQYLPRAYPGARW